MFLFDRAAVRFFRKDGFAWRKKPDGRTVRETHEKLKVLSVSSLIMHGNGCHTYPCLPPQVNDKEALHCYYAHTDPTDSIQRRCYWLTEATEDIVLVHYLQLVNPRHANRAIRPRPAVQDSSVASGTPPSYTSSPRSLHGSEEQAPFGSGGYVDEVCTKGDQRLTVPLSHLLYFGHSRSLPTPCRRPCIRRIRSQTCFQRTTPWRPLDIMLTIMVQQRQRPAGVTCHRLRHPHLGALCLRLAPPHTTVCRCRSPCMVRSVQ